jgi:mRNA-degrading endonuclease RelE of RelBE toxin-antitoxin system
MALRSHFDIIYAPQIKQHLRIIERKYHSLIRKEIETHLQFTPDVETRNRKPLSRPIEFGADWELRCGADNRFRVFYEIDREHGEVHILAIGVKRGNRLFVGGEEVK